MLGVVERAAAGCGVMTKLEWIAATSFLAGCFYGPLLWEFLKRLRTNGWQDPWPKTRNRVSYEPPRKEWDQWVWETQRDIEKLPEVER